MILLIGDVFKIKPVYNNKASIKNVENIDIKENEKINHEPIEIEIEEEVIIEEPIQITKKFQSPLNENNKKTQKVKSEKKINKKKLWNIFE